jgi:hypothetical protein
MVIILVVADDHFRGGIGDPGLPRLIVTRFAVSGPQRVKATVEQNIHELDQTIAISENRSWGKREAMTNSLYSK